MATGEFLNSDEESRLVALIARVERATTGEIRIHLAKKVSRYGAIHDAARAFRKLGMESTTHHNGVLIFVAARDRAMACIGDKGIHAKVGDAAWRKVVDGMRAHFAKGDHYLGLHYAIESLGALLKEHFPRGENEPKTNELPDEISKD